MSQGKGRAMPFDWTAGGSACRPGSCLVCRSKRLRLTVRDCWHTHTVCAYIIIGGGASLSVRIADCNKDDLEIKTQQHGQDSALIYCSKCENTKLSPQHESITRLTHKSLDVTSGQQHGITQALRTLWSGHYQCDAEAAR